MDFSIEKDTRDYASDKIFFHNLSQEAKEKALEIKGIDNPSEASWEILPIVYHWENISSLSQQEIDDEVLCYLSNMNR